MVHSQGPTMWEVSGSYNVGGLRDVLCGTVSGSYNVGGLREVLCGTFSG